MSADERPDARWSDEALDKLRDALLAGVAPETVRRRIAKYKRAGGS